MQAPQPLQASTSNTGLAIPPACQRNLIAFFGQLS